MNRRADKLTLVELLRETADIADRSWSNTAYLAAALRARADRLEMAIGMHRNVVLNAPGWNPTIVSPARDALEAINAPDPTPPEKTVVWPR